MEDGGEGWRKKSFGGAVFHPAIGVHSTYNGLCLYSVGTSANVREYLHRSQRVKDMAHLIFAENSAPFYHCLGAMATPMS